MNNELKRRLTPRAHRVLLSATRPPPLSSETRGFSFALVCTVSINFPNEAQGGFLNLASYAIASATHQLPFHEKRVFMQPWKCRFRETPQNFSKSDFFTMRWKDAFCENGAHCSTRPVWHPSCSPYPGVHGGRERGTFMNTVLERAIFPSRQAILVLKARWNHSSGLQSRGASSRIFVSCRDTGKLGHWGLSGGLSARGWASMPFACRKAWRATKG